MNISSAPGQSLAPSAPLNVLLTVKETAGVGASEYPTTVVVPLEAGRYQDVKSFRVVDASGNTVPAQFEVLTRWWAKDNSLRHIAVHFQPTVSAFTGEGSGIAEYSLRDDGQGNYAPSPITLTETSSEITVNTGVLQFVLRKDHFTILDQVWLDGNTNGVFDAEEEIISPNSSNGGLLVPRAENTTGPQYDAARSDITVEVEEQGPLRVVIRAEALTHYASTTDHTHGWAVRIYAYAGKSYLKIDYQLQNSAKNVVYAWPLYFESLNLNFKLNLDPASEVKIGLGKALLYKRPLKDGVYLAQEHHDVCKMYDLQTGSSALSATISDGFLDISDGTHGVTAMIRNFWQMWPNGLQVDGTNTLSLQLFPEWSAQFTYNNTQGSYELNPTGLYWLEDMQHVYKETLLWFHGPSVSPPELSRLAKTFQYRPVVVIPTSHYRQSKATLDLAGIIPADGYLWSSSEDLRVPVYKSSAFTMSAVKYYQFGWDNFKVDLHRKNAPAMPGEWPYGNARFLVTGNPADYYNAEDFAMGELNVRPQWIAKYNHDHDWSFLQLSENPYAGGNWRKFSGHGRYHGEPYLKGTGRDALARDDEHGWFYHVEDAYYLTGNPWIRDWYEFIAEFRQVILNHLDPYPNRSSRAMGHGAAHAMQAYRITGNAKLLASFQDFIAWIRFEAQHPIYGYKSSASGGREAAFQVGFLARALINFMEAVRGQDWQAYTEAFQLLSGFMEWNLNYSHFSSYINASKGEIGQSAGSGLTLVDPQMWYYWHTGNLAFLDQVEQYVTGGSNGGQKPYSPFKRWAGEYEGRYYLFGHNTPRLDTSPPAPITDLQVTRSGTNLILNWTAPPDNDLERYHIVWSDKPISATQTTDGDKTNWWAAQVVGPALMPLPEAQQTLTLPEIPEGPVYVAIFTFDLQQNMSPMSQKALTVTTTGPGTVRSDPVGIDCGSVCRAAFDDGTVVTLTAIPDIGSTFAGWAGACHGIGQCKVMMNDAKRVIANFEVLIGEMLLSKEQELKFDRGGDRSLPFVYHGDIISYTITVTNLFNVAVNLMISDALSAFVDYVAGTLEIEGETVSDDFLYFNDDLLEYESDPLLTNQSLSISFDVRVVDDAYSEAIIENSASVYGYFAEMSGTSIMNRSSNLVQAQVQKSAPEPSTVIFFGTGLLGIFAFVLRKGVTRF